MELDTWVTDFREMHKRAKAGTLSQAEAASYFRLRNEIAKGVLASQRVTVPPEMPPRRMVRIARAVKVDLLSWDEMVSGLTTSIGSGGFGANLPKRLRDREGLNAVLHLPEDREIKAGARVVGASNTPGRSWSTSFQFVDVGLAAQEMLESFVFDVILKELEVVARGGTASGVGGS
jgi:hypothetical protein